MLRSSVPTVWIWPTGYQWFIATLRVVPVGAMAPALRQAEATASGRFPARDVVAAMRRVLSVELAHRL